MSLRRHWLTILVAVVIIGWFGGLIWFISQLPSDGDTSPDLAMTDAIIVLTGGSQRVENGLNLLAEGRAKKLFVSGVYRSTDVKALLHASNQQPKWLSCCIELGREAENTRGNAAETAAWMKAEKFHSLRLVTASYHMPRSLLEFSWAMPDIRIIPNPVFPKSAPGDSWHSPHAAMLVVDEYMKYLFAYARLQIVGPAS